MKALTDSYNRQKKERWNSPAIPSLTTLYDDSPAGRRKMVLFLYALVTPPFVLTMSLLAKPFSPYPIAAVFFLCLTAGLWIFFRKNPFQFDWVFPAGIAPTLSCAIASTSFGNNGLAFIAVMTAPLAWSAVLFELPTVITAWTVSTASCFFLSYQSSGFYPAVANTAIFGIIQFLVALVVYGKASRFRTARLESLERSLNDIELIMRTDGRLVEVNDRAVEIYGYTRRELLSMKAAQLRLPEEENLVRQQLKTLLRKRSFLFETQHVRKDGTKIPVEVSARLFQAKGETYIHSLVRDISERKEYEIKLVEANRHLAEKRFSD